MFALCCFASGGVSEPDIDILHRPKNPHNSTETPVTFEDYIRKPEEKRPDILHNKNLKIMQNEMKVSIRKIDPTN